MGEYGTNKWLERFQWFPFYPEPLQDGHKMELPIVVRSSAFSQFVVQGASQASGTLFSSSSGDLVREPVMICIGLKGGSSCIAGFVRCIV